MINTKRTREGISEELKEIIVYLDEEKVKDEAEMYLHEAVPA